ncbi:MAG: hypothetical protein WEB57_00620 [Pseudohongiellaceae bacterium]
MTTMTERENQGPLATLWAGDAGLAKTYWLYCVVAGLVGGLLLAATGMEPGAPLTVIVLALIGSYFFIAYVGLWRASNKYEGPSVWAILSKIVVVLGFLTTVAPIAFGVLASVFS